MTLPRFLLAALLALALITFAVLGPDGPVPAAAPAPPPVPTSEPRATCGGDPCLATKENAR